ncbi:MAG: TldD/PmbA family protein [Lachnospiraceae bacterium]|nr:TldD/PmbA family protein [Lachnospiraceae bacterium]
MKAPFSEYLESIAPAVKKAVDDLSRDHDYVSALCTDSKGLVIRIGSRSRSISNKTMTTERGVVFRVCKDKKYSEYAVNTADWSDTDAVIAGIRKELELQDALLKSSSVSIYETGVLEDEPLEFFGQKDTELLPEKTDLKTLTEKLIAISDKGMGMSDRIIECIARAQSTHISKMFLTKNRDLRQSYVYSEGMVAAVASSDGKVKEDYKTVSGIKGPELFDEMEALLEPVVNGALELLNADPIEPGEYEIITSPEVTGLIAHEAFGHGVEMDMFVKHRALGADYIGKRVASDNVTMHEGALCAENVTSYFFDDEGVMAGDVTEIENGILRSGICDSLAALRLGVKPTGNGKRENFAHKVYTRMTNTMFDSGSYSKDEMIASVKYGYLLEGMQSGMEDPKHWGIQCIIQKGREIRDGKLTGKVVAPVIMTGYVPELLGNITMCSTDRMVFGSGGCGKGHKEWVKVADGGPYLKTKGRLG